jgi:alcohol dehydrogenase (cytochrome c)
MRLAGQSYPSPVLNEMMLSLLFSKTKRVVASTVLLSLFVTACAGPTRPPTGGPDLWWPTFGGTYANTRHAELTAIDPSNVSSLQLAWRFNTGIHGIFEVSPVVTDGVMYITTGTDNGVYALNAETGEQKWHYVPKLGRAPYNFAVNRGVAVDAGRVFFNTLDDRLIALDAATGKPLWDSRIGDPREGLREDAAPLAWSGLVFVGSAGNELGVRGSYSAYSQKDGKLVWRWWAVGPGWEGTFQNSAHGIPLHRDIAREQAALKRYSDAWKTGGGAIWMTPALSPQDSTIYLSTGNPAPAFNGAQRPGDNLYTECIVALDARTGKMKWYYQETPHDVWDYDASSPPVLVDALDPSGRRVPAVVEAGKSGWLYVVDRATGKLLRVSEPFVPQPHVYAPFDEKGATVQPGDLGGAIGPISYDPGSHATFIAGDIEPEIAQTFKPGPRPSNSDEQWAGGIMAEVATQRSTGVLTSIDVDSGHVRWTSPVPNLVFGGTLSTNGLVFLGEQGAGKFRAYDATTGKVLWQVNPGDAVLSRFDLNDRVHQFITSIDGASKRLYYKLRHQEEYTREDIHAPPIAYRMNGREYVAITSHVYSRSTRAGGDTVFAFSLP